MMRRTFLFVELVFLSYLISGVSGNGTLFVGFLGYANPTNRLFNGECCDPVGDTENCTDFCDLIFEVSVQGLDSSLTNGKRPSENPIGNNDVILFPSAYEGVINPVSFDFRKWPGNVNITIDIYDQDDGNVLQRVDRFVFKYEQKGPSMDYWFRSATTEQTQSELKMIFRYSCDPTYYGIDCGTDCLFQSQNKACPDFKPPVGTSQSITDWIYLLTTPKSTTTRRCSTLDSTRDGENNETLSNCSSSTTQVPETKESTLATERTTTKPTIQKTSKNIPKLTSDTVTTPSFIDNQITTKTGTFFDVTTASYSSEVKSSMGTGTKTSNPSAGNTTSNLFPTSTKLISTKTKQTTKLTTPVISSNHRSTESTTKSMDIVTSDGSYPESNTRPDLNNSTVIDNKTQENDNNSRYPINIRKTTDFPALTPNPPIIPTTVGEENNNKNNESDVMTYWPAIVGGILGGLALIAGVAIFMYFRKQKARQHKRQDIYNVNPKTWALETQENGTSGKSEIALETEPV